MPGAPSIGLIAAQGAMQTLPGSREQKEAAWNALPSAERTRLLEAWGRTPAAQDVRRTLGRNLSDTAWTQQLARGTSARAGDSVLQGVGTALGGAAQRIVAPALGLTGIGLPLAAGIGAAGGALRAASSQGERSILGDAATGAAAGAAGHAARGILGLGGAAAAPGAAGGAAGTAAQAAGGAGGIGSRILGWIGQNPGTAAGIGLAGINALSGSGRSGDAEAARNRARALMQTPEREDLSDLYRDPSNPYQSPRLNKAKQAAQNAVRTGY